MKTINFIACGMMGDFIHSLSVVKNICEREDAKANIFITDRVSIYGGDVWRSGINGTYDFLHDIVVSQTYVNSFNILSELPEGAVFNLNAWRGYIMGGRIQNGYYENSWSEFLSGCYNFTMPREYKWINTSSDESVYDNAILIHRSAHRHNPLFNWESILKSIEGKKYFITSSINDWDRFNYQGFVDDIIIVNNLDSMSRLMSRCKYFIGNQSAPFALASALDVSRLVELDIEPAPFYMNETKYSNNISWFLNNEQKYFSENSLVKF